MYNLENVEEYIPSLTKKDILDIISEEEIFRHYLGFDFKLGRMYHSPFRKDKNPSFNIYYTPTGEIRFKDFNGRQGSCFDLVMLITGSTFITAINIINSNMNLGLNGPKNIAVKKIEYKCFKNEIVKDKKNTLIQFKPQHFTKEDLEYWAQFNIDEKILKQYNVFSGKYVFVNKKLIFRYSISNPIYCYKLPNNKVKIYRPKANKGNYKWLSNATNNELQGSSQLTQENETLVITKSMKDVMCLRSFGIDSIAPQAETSYMDDEIINGLDYIYPKIFILYDNDNAGIKGAKELHKLLPHANIIYIPKESNCKDISEYVSMYGINKGKELLIKLI
jgi:5S rRNA maturation endonuclease (ribonuclease M5)|tara:strand:+ start:791 stop:1792 length:1002 start_codon:yes stop_codon:yes gene_type:complete